MMDFLFNSMWGWVGSATVIVILCGVVAYFVPPLRRLAIGIAGLAATVAAIYAKGNRDRAAIERRQREEAVKRLNKKYDEIERRPDTTADVKRRLDNGTF
jgi:hypothetical protein